MSATAVRESPGEVRPVLPVCLLATVDAGDAEAAPDVLGMRMLQPGGIVRAFAIEGGVGSSVGQEPDRLETRDNLLPDPATVAAQIGALAEGALLVAWDLEATRAALRRYHPAPQEVLGGAVLELDLRSIALLLEPGIDARPPSIEQLAAALVLTPPKDGVRELGWFLARVVRRLGTSGRWLTRVAALGFEERAILETCVERLAAGVQQYGPWPREDARNLGREAYEEVIDALHYAAARLVQLRETADGEVR